MTATVTVCLSVRHKSCPLHKSKTVQDIFTKIDTNVDHDKSVC